MNTKQLLDQDELWQTRDGMPMSLEEMDPGHRSATLAFLRRRAAYLERAYAFCEVRALLDSHPAPYHRMLAARQLMAERERALSDGPEAWLERRPLIITLARLVAEDAREGNTVDGEVVVRALPAGQESAR